MNADLTLEACQLGDEAIKLAMRANAMAFDDFRRWECWKRMLEINHRLKQITLEVTEHETCSAGG